MQFNSTELQNTIKLRFESTGPVLNCFAVLNYLVQGDIIVTLSTITYSLSKIINNTTMW